MNRCVPSLLALLLSATAVGMAPSPAAADDGRAKRGADAGNARDAAADMRERQWAADASDEKWERDPISFTVRERETIRTHYRAESTAPPPGPSTPAIRKPLQRNTVLPPRLQQRLQPLALDVERRLNVLPRGYSRGVLGPDVLLVENRTQRIIDIIRDVNGRR